MEGIPLKKQKLDTDTNVNEELCVICQEDSGFSTTTSENGRKRVCDAAVIRGKDDVVAKRLTCMKQNFVYHMNNKCYKTYTHKKSLDKLSHGNETDAESEENMRSSTRLHAPRDPIDKTEVQMNVYNKICVVCACKKHNNVYEKFRICEMERARKFLHATRYFQDDVYTRTSDLHDPYSVFGADIYCHKTCISGYLMKYDAALIHPEKRKSDDKLEIIEQFVQKIMPSLNSGKGYPITELTHACNASSSQFEFSNRDIKTYLMNKYGSDISFTKPQEVNKP